jgi:hypothetical protein
MDVILTKKEIASIVKHAIEVEKPLFRYQTTDNIKKQAAQRLVDITGTSWVCEWESVLFPYINTTLKLFNLIQ